MAICSENDMEYKLTFCWATCRVSDVKTQEYIYIYILKAIKKQYDTNLFLRKTVWSSPNKKYSPRTSG
jgi:hypothetical protein